MTKESVPGCYQPLLIKSTVSLSRENKKTKENKKRRVYWTRPKNIARQGSHHFLHLGDPLNNWVIFYISSYTLLNWFNRNNNSIYFRLNHFSPLPSFFFFFSHVLLIPFEEEKLLFSTRYITRWGIDLKEENTLNDDDCFLRLEVVDASA